MSLPALASDLACLARRDGVPATVRKAAGVLRAADVIVLRKRLDEIVDIAFERRLALTELVPADLGALAELNRRRCDTRSTSRFAADLACGRRGFVARRDGELVGWYWWVDREHPHLRPLGITLAPGEVYGFDFFLAEEHRGDGHAVELLHGIETRLRELGYTRLWGYVHRDNRPARWLYGMRGYENVATVHVKRGRLR